MSQEYQICSVRFKKTDFERAKMLCRFYGYNSITELTNYLIAEWLKDKEVTVKGK